MAIKVSIYYEWEKLADTANIYSIILQHAKVVCLKRRLAWMRKNDTLHTL